NVRRRRRLRRVPRCLVQAPRRRRGAGQASTRAASRPSFWDSGWIEPANKSLERTVELQELLPEIRRGPHNLAPRLHRTRTGRDLELIDQAVWHVDIPNLRWPGPDSDLVTCVPKPGPLIGRWHN